MGKMTDRFIGETPRKITEDGLGNCSARLVPTNSVIMSTRAPIGHLAINKVPMAFNQGCRGMVPGSRLDPTYLYHFLSANTDALNALGTGATFKELSSSALKAFPIPLPPLEEQQRIVSVLDEAFEGLARARAHAEANLQNARELFALNFEHELLKHRETSTMTTIGEICDDFEYGTSAKSQPSGQMAVLRMGNMQLGEIDWGDLVYTDVGKDIEKLALKDGDVLFNRTNSLEHVGKAAIYRGEIPAIFAGYLIRLHFCRSKLHPDFLNLFLNSEGARKYGRSIAGKSVNQANISASKLRTYPISLPSRATQEDIVRKAESIRQPLIELQRCYQAKLQHLDDLRQSLLQKAFAGELT